MFVGLPLENPAEFGEILDLILSLGTFHHSPQISQPKDRTLFCTYQAEYLIA